MYYTHRSNLRTEDIDGETVLLDEQGGYIHQLNHTASFIWRQCDGKTSVESIIRMLIREFDVEEAIAAQDVEDVIERLRCQKLLFASVR